MVPQSKGKIFLSAERGLKELSGYRSYHTFNFGQYYNEHKMPFGGLYVLNEDTLAGKQTVTAQIEQDSDIILIPVVGAVECNKIRVEAGESLHLHTKAGTSLVIANPYKTELVKYLQVWMKTQHVTGPELTSFNLHADRNQLFEVNDNIWIGKFDARKEAVYQIEKPGNGVFVFVIEGEFEVQYRLLQTGDSLALWEIETVELEALSDGIILIIETKL
jgi:hypothetical protein